MEKNYKKILVISLAGIGDFIMATPTIKALRDAFPLAKIDLLTFPKGAKEITDGGPYFDEVYLYTHRGNTLTKDRPPLFKTVKDSVTLILKLRKNKYDLSLSLFPSASNSLGFLARLIGAKKRMGFQSKYYTNKISWNYKEHKVDQNLKLLKPLGIKAKSKIQFIHLLKENKIFAREFLRKNKSGNGPLIGFHPGSWWRASVKKWPLQNYAELSKFLIKKYGANILVVCGPSEEKIGAEIKASLNYSKKVIILEKQDLKNSAAIIGKCDAFVSSDSGMMHVAEAMNIPIIEIPGYTLFKFSGVYKKENKKNIVWKDIWCYEKCPVLWKFDEEFEGRWDKLPCKLECYTQITPKKVLKVLDKVLMKRNISSKRHK